MSDNFWKTYLSVIKFVVFIAGMISMIARQPEWATVMFCLSILATLDRQEMK